MERIGKFSRLQHIAGWFGVKPGLVAALILGGTAAAQRPPQPPDSGWTLVPATDWYTLAPGLVGKNVEVSGNLATQLMVNPRSSFSNTGWMRDDRNRELATVLFDQIDDAQVAWMRKNKCNTTCAGVFVRGEVVSGRGRRGPVLRMMDVSFESRAGGVAASIKLDPDRRGAPAVEKQLLPSGTVPTVSGASAVTQIPATTPDTAEKACSKECMTGACACGSVTRMRRRE